MATRRIGTVVLVFGGDPVVGRALELLLRGVGYDARFFTMTSLDKPNRLDGAQLLLFAGGVDAEQRDVSLSRLKSVLDGIPILELVSSLEEAQAGTNILVPWPCRAAELKRQIDAALSVDPTPKEGR